MDLPPGWTEVSGRSGRRPVARIRVAPPDGRLLEWSAWHHRKGLGLLDALTGRPVGTAPGAAVLRNRWIAAAFVVGSSCFALGSLPPLAARLRDDALGVFLAGSIFFTVAAYLQFREAGNAAADLEGAQRSGRLVRIRAGSVGWWATAVQLVGTVAFNVSTAAPFFVDSVPAEQALVWAPDAVGSICFLVASWLALTEICSGASWWRPGSTPWVVAVVNLAGSVAFGVAAVAARILPTTGDPANIAVVNATTFTGAVLFLVGAALLPRAVERSTS